MKPLLALSHLLILSTSLLCVAPIVAKQQSDQNAQKGGRKPCATADSPYRIEAKHIEAKGIGYGLGYTSIDGFFTGMVGELIPFLDLRAHVFNNGKWAANAGVGTRFVINPCSSMFGINAYYDYRDTKHGHFNQVGAGLEGYVDRFEARINGYLPVGTKRKAYGSEVNSLVFNNFEGHYATYTTNLNEKVEAAMRGFTSEVGAHIAGDMKNYDLYFGLGPYYFDAEGGKNMWGGKVRLKAEVTKYVFLEISDSYDRVFHNRFQGTATLSVPFGGKKCYRTGRCRARKGEAVDNVMDWRATLPVERQEIIVISKFKKTRSVDPIAYNPVTGAPYYFIFVNNTNTALNPDGSIENPVANLSNGDGLPSAQSLATANNIIYVFPGNGTSSNMQAGMPLNANGLRMLGSGISNSFTTPDGVLVIPPQSSTYPLIAGSVTGGTDAVLINANSCEVSGFMMSPALGGGLGATGKASVRVFTTNVTNLTVTNNVILNGMWGISLNDDATTSTSGTIIISDNVISEQQAAGTVVEAAGINVQNSTNANLLVSNNTVTFGSKTSTSQSCDGILIQPGNNTVYQILSNGIEEMSNPGIKIAIQAGTGAVTTSGSINGNAISNCLYGVEIINNNAGTSSISVTNNTVSGSTGTFGTTTGITDFRFAVATGSTLCVRFNYNTWSNNVVFDQKGGTSNFIQLEPPINPNGGAAVFTTGSKVFPVQPCFCGVSGTTCFP